MNGGGAWLCLCTTGRVDIKECVNYRGSNDEPHYKTVGEGNRSKNKKVGDDR